MNNISAKSVLKSKGNRIKIKINGATSLNFYEDERSKKELTAVKRIMSYSKVSFRSPSTEWKVCPCQCQDDSYGTSYTDFPYGLSCRLNELKKKAISVKLFSIQD